MHPIIRGLSVAILAFALGCGDRPECGVEEAIVVWLDRDGDGYGDPNEQRLVCEIGPGQVTNNDDCDDTRAEVAPGRAEICDGLDNDCNGRIDDGLPLTTFYPDRDGDGHGVDRPDENVRACAVPNGYSELADDCDDNDANNFPGNQEVCDGQDNNCNGKVDDRDPNLDPTGQQTFYRDADGDGYGDPDNSRALCEAWPGWVTNADDCNDNVAAIHPGAPEVCNGADDNCNGLIDDDDPSLDTSTWRDWYADLDGDGLGDPNSMVSQCAPLPGHVRNGMDCDDTDPEVGPPSLWRFDGDGDGVGAGAPVIDCFAPPNHVLASLGDDCDDNDPEVYPGRLERCNGTDDNCNGLIDDDDPHLDPASATTFHPDRDGDGFGDRYMSKLFCVQPPNVVRDGTDCDDFDAAVNPLAQEVCDGIDNDCDDLIDDEDPDVDPATFSIWFHDGDGDGFGDLTTAMLACDPPEGFVGNGVDCDDDDPRIGDPPLWYFDLDGDGHGSGLPVYGPSCTGLEGLAPDSYGFDCDDDDPDISPSATEICEDGIDNDCSGYDAVCPLPTTCLEWLEVDRELPSGTYVVEPTYGGPYLDVWCDMDTDGGGWTLVGASAGRPLSDRAVPWHPNLIDLYGGLDAPGVWDGLRPVYDGANTDMRFTCKLGIGDDDMEVDLSIYDVPWYMTITTGTDADSCFSEGNGEGSLRPAPARRDNISGDFLPLGTEWGAGFLSGEKTCDSNDFTIDFNDRGVGGDPDDGTDWGLADGVWKCGVSYAGEGWYLFVR